MESGTAYLVIIGVLYISPWLYALSRKHNNSSAIGALTILLGWTVLGWIIAIIWASTNNTRYATERHYDRIRMRDE